MWVGGVGGLCKFRLEGGSRGEAGGEKEEDGGREEEKQEGEYLATRIQLIGNIHEGSGCGRC